MAENSTPPSAAQRLSSTDQALALGKPVFPCRNSPRFPNADKIPLTPNGFKDASTDPGEIGRIFKGFPGCLIGVPTGAVSGIDVLDIDARKGGAAWYKTNSTRLPPTRLHRTRNGGLHLLFQHMPSLRCTASKIAPGIDTRADGGYIIWWPAAGLDSNNYPLSRIPAWPLWLLPAMMSQPTAPPPPYEHGFAYSDKHIVAKIAGLERALANCPEGNRNNLCNWAGYAMRALVASGRIRAEHVAYKLAKAATASGLPYAEAERAVRSGMGVAP